MRYIWQTGQGADRRVMHIARFTATGEMLFESLCRRRLAYNRSINAPFGLGRPICKACRERV